MVNDCIVKLSEIFVKRLFTPKLASILFRHMSESIFFRNQMCLLCWNRVRTVASKFCQIHRYIYPMLNGLPKLHKNGISLRPILASAGSFNYESAVWLNKNLMLLNKNDSNVKNKFDLREKLFDIVN